MSYCVGCSSWTPDDLCDSCGFHSARVWARDDESYPEEQGIAENRSEDGQTANGGDDAK